MDRARSTRIAFAATMIAVFAVVGFLSFQLVEERQQRRTAAEVQAAARVFLEGLTTYSFDSLDQDTQRVLEMTTGRFREEYEEEISVEDFGDTIVAGEGRSSGAVIAVEIESALDDRAEVVAVVQRTTESKETEEPHLEVLRFELTMQRLDGAWKASEVNIRQL